MVSDGNDDVGNGENSSKPSSTTIYRQVNFKKSEGNLTLTIEGITFNPFIADCTEETSTSKLFLPWIQVVKHQVSPSTYPKALLKLTTSGKKKTLTFQLFNREELERIRKDVTIRLRSLRKKENVSMTNKSNGNVSKGPASKTDKGTVSGKKRPHVELLRSSANKNISSVTELDDDALAVTRMSLLANNTSLRSQYEFLVEEAKTISEDDFWRTHESMLQEEYARICGMASARTSSVQSSLPPLHGKVTLSVEEMRQIFILYPAVHKAYEEKVPVELSDEQFWRKYLESEYFHRDREPSETAKRSCIDLSKTEDHVVRPTAKSNTIGNGMPSAEDSGGEIRNTTNGSSRKLGTHLAVGQFDLASTFETERGDLLEGPRDNHPSNATDDGKGARVIEKYNRHWAMVFHMDKAKKGDNLMDVARQSVHDVLENDEDAKTGGGLDKEMKRLVEFSMATETNANHAQGLSLLANVAFEELTLRNDLKAPGQQQQEKQLLKRTTEGETEDENGIGHFDKCLISMAQKMQEFEMELHCDANKMLSHNCFPATKLALKVISVITDKIAQDSKTNSDHLKKARDLPEDFKKRLNFYFQRSSEMLRHFYGIRKLDAQKSCSPKLKKIVSGIETFHLEVERMCKEFPPTETGERMRKMCCPIIDQLDWALQLHKTGAGKKAK